MTIRKTLQWVVAIVLLGTVVGGTYVYSLWARSDEILRQEMLTRMTPILSGCKLHIERANYDWNRRVRVFNITLTLPGHDEPIVRVPQALVTIDREEFARTEQIVIQRVEISRPVVNLTRDANGRWNFHDLPQPPRSYRTCPEWVVDEGAVNIRMEHPNGEAPHAVEIHHANLKLIPSGYRQYLVDGSTQIDSAGNLTVNGKWNLDTRVWSVKGGMTNVAANQQLVALIAGISTELKGKLARVDTQLRGMVGLKPEIVAESDHPSSSLLHSPRPLNGFHDDGTDPFLPPDGLPRSTPATPWRTADASSESVTLPQPRLPVAVPDFDLAGQLDVDFKISQKDVSSEPDFQMDLNVRNGAFEYDVLPFPLRNLNGSFRWDNQKFVVRSLDARNGISRFSVSGLVDRQTEASQSEFTLALSDLALDVRLYRRLTPQLKALFDKIRPTGNVDISLKMRHDGAGGWKAEGFTLAGKNGTITHENFPYAVQQVHGTMRQQGEGLQMQFRGMVGKRPVDVVGATSHFGAGARHDYTITALNVPLEATLVDACPTAMKKTIESLRAQGMASVQIKFHNPLGSIGKKFQMKLDAIVSESAIHPVFFPYRVENLSGRIQFDSTTGLWKFEKLKGTHNAAELTGEGRFAMNTGPTGKLEMAIRAENGRFDRDLEMALPLHLRRIWNHFAPQGRLDTVASVHWSPGSSPQIELPVVRVSDGRMLMSFFPYPLHHARGTGSYKNGRVEITSFNARHEDTKIRGVGFVQTAVNGDWRARLTQIDVDDLIPDRVFRRALPPDLRDVFEEMDLQGPVSVSGMLEFRGTKRPQDPVTAAWDLETVFTGNDIVAGTDLENVHGHFSMRGTWDGKQTVMQGEVDLDSLAVLDYQLTQVKGPLQLVGNRITVGSADVFSREVREKNEQIPYSKRITGRAVDGVVTFDAVANLSDNPVYNLHMTLNKGSLEEYANRYMPGVKNVKGVLNGWIDLYGTGSSVNQMSGRGQLQISPAALYELPVIAQTFKVLSFAPPDRTAFRYAFLDFVVGRQKFAFNTIDLAGDAISFRGRGTAGFDGSLNLDFYSMLPRHQLPIPIVNAVIGEATKGWVGVEVRGKTSAPMARVKPVPAIDAALKNFLGAFEGRSPTVRPTPFVQPGRPTGRRSTSGAATRNRN